MLLETKFKIKTIHKYWKQAEAYMHDIKSVFINYLYKVWSICSIENLEGHSWQMMAYIILEENHMKTPLILFVKLLGPVMAQLV